MKVEFGKYYKLKPHDWSHVIGKCIGKSKVCDKTYIFEFYFCRWYKYEVKKGAFSLWAISDVSEQEVERYLLPYKLNGDLPVKFLEKISKL